MAGIPVHTSSPINDSNAANSLPHVTSPPAPPEHGSVSAGVSSTAASMYPVTTGQSGNYNVRTSPAGATSTYSPSDPTKTTSTPTSTASGPPAPQPGQAPTPTVSGTKSSVPPPPKASVSTHTQTFPSPLQTQSAAQPNYPPPMSASPGLTTSSYTYAQPPAGVTSTAQDLSHPPGYVQNHHASFDDRTVESDNGTQNSSPTRSNRGRGILDGVSVPQGDHEAENSPMWDTAVSWAKEVGKKLSDAEGDVWKKINGEK